MPVTTDNIADFFKTRFLKEAGDATLTSTPLSAEFCDRASGRNVISGDSVQGSIQIGSTSAVQMRIEGETRPTPGNPTFKKFTLALFKCMLSIGMTNETLTKALGNEDTFGDVMLRLNKDAINQGNRVREFSLAGTGDMVLAQCGASGPSTTVALNTTTTLTHRLAWMRRGMKVDIGSAAVPTSITAAATIVSVNLTNKTITIDVAVTVTSAAFVTLAGSGITSGEYRAGAGLEGIVDDTSTYLGINPATYPEWASTVFASGAGARPLTPSLLQESLIRHGRIHDVMPGTKLQCWTGPGQEFALGEFMAANYGGFADYKQSLESGFATMVVHTPKGDITVNSSDHLLDTSAYIIDKSQIEEGVAGVSASATFKDDNGWRWDTVGHAGSPLHDRYDGVHGYQADAYRYATPYTQERWSHFRIDDLTAPFAA